LIRPTIRSAPISNTPDNSNWSKALSEDNAGKQMDLDANKIDANELRRALGCFVTGVTVITTVAADGEPRGFTANSFTSVSLDPPLVLACIARHAGSFDVFRNARAFAINILQEDQRDISATFASSSKPDKFAGLQWTTSKAGSPLLPACSAWLDCEMHQQIEAGDHVILIGRVVDFEHSPRTPLGYYSGTYVGFGMERRAVEGSNRRPACGSSGSNR
jgi:flavin reductase (DIM6/NTAB) family NADH-FMN oxidoreductase RutF